MMKVAFVMLAGAAIGTPAWAAADQDGPSAVYELGRCIVKSDREAAGRLLQDMPLADGETQVTAAALGRAGDCLKGQPLSTSTTAIRGAVAQALLLKDFPRFGVEPKIASHLFIKMDLPIDKTAAGVDERTASLYKLADCVVRNQALKTEVLFRSAPGSEREGRVLDELSPYIGACHGQQTGVRISRPEFRSLMAQAAYNVSVRYWTGSLWSAK